jgi:hypothetical protein
VKKPFRRGSCPGCYRPCRRRLYHWPSGNKEIIQPYCARCGGRGRHRGGIYLVWPDEARVNTRQVPTLYHLLKRYVAARED